MSSKIGTDDAAMRNRTLNRRNILLSGTTLAATSALGSGAPTKLAQAQARKAPAGQQRVDVDVNAHNLGVWQIALPKPQRGAPEYAYLQKVYGLLANS